MHSLAVMVVMVLNLNYLNLAVKCAAKARAMPSAFTPAPAAYYSDLPQNTLKCRHYSPITMGFMVK